MLNPVPQKAYFRDSLRKLELARKAFLVADNSSALRRALLRKPRKQPSGFDVGDWGLYWRQNKGNVKGERGRSHGPGQIITMESNKIAWISHGGYLIRASPQQVRPASLREHARLPRDINGRIVPEAIREGCKNFVSLEGIPEEVAEDVPRIQNVPVLESRGSEYQSQPDAENFPSEIPSSISLSPSLAEDPIEPEAPSGPIDTPVPEWNDEDESEREGDDAMFGDDVDLCVCSDGVWECTFGDGPESDVHEVCFCEHPEILEWANLATGARKQRVEVQ